MYTNPYKDLYMQLTIESSGHHFFRKVIISEYDKVFATIKFKFSFFQKASIFIGNKIWSFTEKGLIDTYQAIADSENKVIITRKVNTSQQIKNYLYMNSSPLVTIHIGESTYNLEAVDKTQKYIWLKNGVPLGISYDLNDLIRSESKFFPRFRGLWKFYATLPENADELTTSILFLGLIELIQKATLVYLS